MNKMLPTHKGLFCGVIPVYVDLSDPDIPGIEVRGSGIIKCFLEFLMDVVEGAFGAYCMAMSAINPNFEPLYPIKITGEVK